jgi:hypothetical protein
MDRIEEHLKKIEEDLRKKFDCIVGDQNIFPDSFIRAHTKFATLNELLEKSGFECRNQADLESVDLFKLDRFICENTDFKSWQDMKIAAEDVFAGRK